MSEPASRLPARPSLEQLRKQAKELLRAYRDGDAAAAERYRAVISRLRNGRQSVDASLADAQFVLAREYGFESWPKLVRHVETIDPSRAARRMQTPIRPVELTGSTLVELPDGGAATPDDVWSMFVAAREGDLGRVKALVSRHPGLATYEYNYTPPIHFAVREGHIDVVRYLLERGADIAYRSYPFQESLLTMAEDRAHGDVAQLLRAHLARRFAIAEGMSVILDAARKGDLARVAAELARDPSLGRASNETGDTALHQAAQGWHVDVADALLAAGADADAVRGDGYRPIHCALLTNWQFKVPAETARIVADALLAHGAAYNIFIAALMGDREFVLDALSRDASLANFEDTCHQRPISAATHRNDLEMVKLLLSHGADPNLPEQGAPRGHALWHAVNQKQHELVRLLLQHGADPNAEVESSGTPTGHARRDPELFRLLVEFGGNDHKSDPDQVERSILDGDLAAVERKVRAHPELVRRTDAFWGDGILAGPAGNANRELLALLIRYGARVPLVSKWGPYYYFKHYDMAAFLLENGMDPNHMNWHRLTLLHHFAAEGDIPKIRLLLDHAADIDAVDEEYLSTPLGLAARWGRRDAVALLLECGADARASGAPWSTPLEWARRKGHADIEAVLRGAGAA